MHGSEGGLMSQFVDFAVAWAGLARRVYMEFPLAAALVTLAAAVLFMVLERRGGAARWPRRLLRFAIVLVVWAIVVPVLGLFRDVDGAIFGTASATVSGLASLALLIHATYESQPLVVLALFIVSGVVFIVWHLVRPQRPSGTFKAFSCFALFSAGIMASGPIASAAFGPGNISIPAALLR
jgi:hypothetical protein